MNQLGTKCSQRQSLSTGGIGGTLGAFFVGHQQLDAMEKQEGVQFLEESVQHVARRAALANDTHADIAVA